MTTQEIILKLLPFTHKENDQVVFTTDLSLGDWIVTTIEILLIFIFLLALIRLYYSYRKDLKDIKFLESEVRLLKQKGFTYYNTFLDHLKKNPRVYHVWNEFDESLIKRENRLENSLDADYFFNEQSLASHVGSKFYSAIAGILLGIGLLGTFFALYVALVELNLQGDNLKESIRHFIGMVGVKFTASVWGILLSVTFTFIEKGLEARLSDKIRHLQKLIDEIFKRQTAEQNLYIIANETEQQTRALNSLAETLTQKISEQFNPIITQMNNHLQQMPNDISRAIGESLKEPLDALSQNAKMAVESQSDNLGELVQKFVDKIDDAAGQQAQGIQALMANTTQELKLLIVNLQQSNNQMLEQQQKQEEKISRTIEQMQHIFGNIAVNAANNMNEIYSKQQEVIQKQHESIANESIKITEQMQTLLENLAKQQSSQENTVEKVIESLDSLHKNLFDENRKFIEEVEKRQKSILNDLMQKVQDVQSAIDTTAQKLTKVPSMLETFTESGKNLRTFAEATNNATVELNSTIEKLNELQTSLNTQMHGAQEVIHKMDETTKTTNEIVDKVKSSVDEIHTIYDHVIDDNRQNLEAFGQEMAKWLAAYDQQVHATMQNSLNEVQGSLVEFANTLTTSIHALEDALDTINEKLSV